MGLPALATLAGYAANIGDIASAAGSVAGLFGGGTSRTKYFDQMKAEGRIATNEAVRASKLLPSAQVEGFKRAGIHPLYGMSGGAAQYSPSFSGSPLDDGTPTVGQRMSEMGQNLSRSAEAYASRQERELNKRILEAQLKGLELENVSRASNIALKTQAGQPPGVNIIPSDQESSMSNEPAAVAGIPPATQYILNKDGELMVVPSPQAKQGIEDDIPLQAEWYYRNKIIPVMRKYRMFDPWNATREYFEERR